MTDTKPAFARLGRSLGEGQRAELTVIGIDGGGRRVIFTAEEVIEAPNWTPDGLWLIFNAGGELWRIAPEGGMPEKIDTGPLRDLNNDHVLSPPDSQLAMRHFRYCDGTIHRNFYRDLTEPDRHVDSGPLFAGAVMTMTTTLPICRVRVESLHP